MYISIMLIDFDFIQKKKIDPVCFYKTIIRVAATLGDNSGKWSIAE